MNIIITIELTPEERIDLLRFRDRVIAESRDRVYATCPIPSAGGFIRSGIAFTDTSREAERILPILDRILAIHDNVQPNVTTSGGIEQPALTLRTAPFKIGYKVFWTAQSDGSETIRSGVVFAVVPAGERVRNRIPEGFSTWLIPGPIRDHESYLVRVGTSKLLFWPPVGELRSIKP